MTDANTKKRVKPEEKREDGGKDNPSSSRWSRRALRWGLVVVAVIGLAWLGTWLLQRSLRTGSKKRAMQSWLDENLNADVSLLGDMTVRVNLLRDSRLVFHDVQIEHPNPLFPGRFATIERMGAWCSPWSVAKLWPGELDLRFSGANIHFEENEAGEWSTDGFMSPLSVPGMPFPFPLPRVSKWNADIQSGRISLRRRGFEVWQELEAEAFGRMNGDDVVVRLKRAPFGIRRLAPEATGGRSGSLGPATLVFAAGKDDSLPLPVPGRCQARLDGIPASIIPFCIGGIPLEDAPGTFSGVVNYLPHSSAAGVVHFEGEVNDFPLAIFGLPRRTPLRLSWPVFPTGEDAEASIHMGPSGFGAFEMRIPFDSFGNPRLLAMRGNVAALDDLPSLFEKYSRWPNWLSRTFPSIEWRAGKWLGFGWDGENMRLNLYRSTVGLHVTGEAEMLGGRVRLALTPDKDDAPITIAAEKVDAQLLGLKISQMLPREFRAQLTGAHANLTWQGYRQETGQIGEWGAGLVFSKPEIDLSASGHWWRVISETPRAVADILPEWGGGKVDELLELGMRSVLRLDQLSIVSERDAEGFLAVEFRAFGDAFGQATGMIEKSPDGRIEGEFLLEGPSRMLEVVMRANPELGAALELLANDSLGLRVGFRADPGSELEFHYPFIEDARELHSELQREQSGSGE